MASTTAFGTTRHACPHAAERRGPRPACRQQCLVKCDASRSTEAGPSVAKGILPGLMAAALLHASVAHAGVVLQQPQTKKLFQGGSGAPAPSVSSPSLPKLQGPSLPSFKLPSLPGLPAPKTPEIKAPTGGIELDAKFLALPASVALIGAIGFLAYQVDPKAGQFFNEWLVKDSSSYTGYEEDPPQARGSPEGFLGLGNLYSPALPGGQATASKVKQATSQLKPPRGTLPISVGKKGSPKKGAKSKGGFKGLF